MGQLATMAVVALSLGNMCLICLHVADENVYRWVLSPLRART